MKTKKKYQRWSDYERALVVAHHRSFGRGALDLLYNKIPLHSEASIRCELFRFDDWKRTGIMEFAPRAKYINSRGGVRKVYEKIITDLSL